jgi:hypothetical protein
MRSFASTTPVPESGRSNCQSLGCLAAQKRHSARFGIHLENGKRSMSITINGSHAALPDDPRVSLLDFLREELHLPGTVLSV